MLLIWLERYGIHFSTTKHVNVTVTNIIHIGRISSSAAEDSHIRWDWKRRFFLFFFFFFFVPKRQQQYCMSFEFMQSISSNSTHSEQPWQISLNALLTPYPLCALAQTHKQTHVQKKKTKTPLLFLHPRSFFPLLFLPGYHSVAAHEGEESALICQSEQPFHRASLHSASVPEWELLISPGRLACSRLLGSPR